MYYGWLPTGYKHVGITFLFPKLHVNRCLITWKTHHVRTSDRRRANKYYLTIDREFEETVKRVCCNTLLF